jgi:pimeloyl-ACP methyl ester carboxylesterase
LLSGAVLFLAAGPVHAQEAGLGEEGFADSDGVKIHYVTAGKGPLVVMLHGFPDFWYSWRDQMPALAKHHQVAALDLRGFNKSDQPKGVDNYKLDKLVGDVAAVVKHLKHDKAIVVGHDWGGLVAWAFAMEYPEKTERLIVLNLPHPACIQRELAHNPEQQKASAYARNFQKEGAEASLSPALLAFWVKEPEARTKYIEAFKRSSLEAMLNYYRANYPREPYKEEHKFPPVKCPVLMIHGLKDPYIVKAALNDTWKYLDSDLTLVTVPQAGHFVHRDAPEFVTDTMVRWLAQRQK